LALTSHIEAGFQRKLKMGVVFIDLRAAYDPVWERWLSDEIYPGRFLCQAVEFTEQYVIKPFFQVFLGDKSSRWRRLNNRLPQASVLAPLLFSLYLSGIPSTL
jgi:hypothetical protein